MKNVATFVSLLCLQWIVLAPSAWADPVNITFPDDSVDPLATLKAGHPRLIATAEQFDAMAKATDDPLQVEVNKRLLATAEATLKAPLVPYKLDVRHMLLDQCRAAFGHIVLCSMAYRMTHDVRFADRAKQEMLNVAGFKDWDPEHFLSPAEMAMGVAIGYDWCYDALSPQDRKTIKQALMDKALVFAPKLYAKHETDPGKLPPNLRWVLGTNNWNEVCNGGMLAAALAIADEEPVLARQVVQGVRAHLPIGMHSYGPDGAWPEGPVYLSYATNYAVLLLSMLESSLGTDFGLGAVEPAFAKTAMFNLQMHGPNGGLFDFGDAHAEDEIHTGVKPCFAWLADRYGPPILAAEYRQSLRKEFKERPADEETFQYFALNALWLPAEPKDVEAGAPLDAHYRGVADVAVFRSSWGDPDALYVGFKNGRNGTNHSHLDLGSFVLDSDSVRWSAMMGPDAYSLPDYNQVHPGSPRWTYFRDNNYGQSTIIPGHLLQSISDIAPIFSFSTTPDLASAVADLTAIYPGAAQKIIRGVFLQNRARVMVQDDITGLAPNTPLNWQMVTQAKIAISSDGHTATLTRDNKTLRVDLLSPANARFSIASAAPPTPAENQNVGYSILLGTVPAAATASDVRLAVLLTPVGPKWPASLPAPQLEALPAPIAQTASASMK